MSKLTKFKVRRSQFPLDFRIDNTTRDTNIKTLVAMPGTVFEEGTEETAETYNGLQLGLVHSVIPAKSVANGIDYYTCDIEGIADFGMHNELKLQMKITSTNQYDQPKIKINGNDYQIMRFDGVQLTQVLKGQLKTDNIYNLSFNGTLFILSSGMIAEKEVKALLNTTDFQATETINGTSKLATQTEVNNGLEDTKIVTSKKLKARLDTLLAGITSTYVSKTDNATETKSGTIRIASTSQVATGTDNTTAVSPAKLFDVFSSLKTANGYQKMAGGIIFQWGIAQDGVATNYFPIAFPNSCASIQVTRGGGIANGSAGSAGVGASVITGLSNTAFTVDSVIQSGDKSLVYWFAVGY